MAKHEQKAPTPAQQKAAKDRAYTAERAVAARKMAQAKVNTDRRLGKTQDSK